MNIDKKEIQEIIDNKIKAGTKKYGKDFKYFILEILSLERIIAQTVESKKEPKLIPLVKWNDYYPDPSVKALRMLVYRQHENGFSNVIERRGNRILIDADKYFLWRKTKNLKC